MKLTEPGNRLTSILFILICIAFCIYKIPYLSLPTYLDEAWVYAPASMEMAKKGLGLLPDTISNYLGRGHPLFFHFIGALWLKLFGMSVLNLHILSFVIALLLLIATFLISKRMATNTAALVCVIFIVLQPIFIAQSGMFLPEMFLALMALLCILFYIEEKAVLFNIACTLLLFTKESGLMLPVTLGIYTLITGWKNNGLKLTVVKEIKYFLLPFLFISLFFIFQKVMNGWFFFPEHIGLISFDPGSLMKKSVSIFSYSFIYQGRNLLTISFLLFLFWKLYRKIKFREVIINSKYEKLLVVSLLFILFHSFFCMVNFFTPRYSLILISLFVVLSGIMINDVLKPTWLKIIFISAFVVSQYDTLNYRTNSDHNLGYIDEINTLQDVTKTATANRWQDKIIHADFIPQVILTSPASGYVSEKEVFKNENISYCEKRDYSIYICFYRKLEEIECGKPENAILLSSISHGKSRAEIYKVAR
jgi:hypothetical protein